MQISTVALLAFITASPVVAQWTCGGTQYEPGSITFSPQCQQLVTNCVNEFADVTIGDCKDSAGLIELQQQPSSGDNSDVLTAFTDIVNHCINNGYTTATWYQDSQWYWMAAGSTCFNFTMPNVPSDLTTPVQQRLSIQGKNAIAVGWNTYTELDSICVQYGLSAQTLLLQECAETSITYPTSRTWTNVVTLSNLLPGTTYYYKIVSTNSTVGQFLSPRSAGDDTPFSFAAVIDMGVYGPDGLAPPSSKTRKDSIPNIDPELNHTTIWQLAQSINDYDFVVHPGDFAYADNFAQVFSLESNPLEAYQTILEQFWEQVAPIASTKPYMVGPGNHDADCTESNFNAETSCPLGQYNFTDFNVRFNQMMPTTFATESTQASAQSQSQKAQTLAKPHFWYSYDYGMAHITIIDTETDFANSPDGPSGSVNLDAGPFGFNNQQLEFVAADLASVDRTITPWVIVAGHRAWYSTGGSGNICLPCQAAFEELLYTYGVDLAIFGHVHNSQRFVPVYNSTADPNGMNDPKAPMYIVAGGAGNIEGLASVGSNLSFNAFAYADDFSFATINFQDRNHLQVDFIRSLTGEVLDSSVLYKSHNQQFVVQGKNSTGTSTSTSSTSTSTSASSSATTPSSTLTGSNSSITSTSSSPISTSSLASPQSSSSTRTSTSATSAGTSSTGSSSSSLTSSNTSRATSSSITTAATSSSASTTTSITATTSIIFSNSTTTTSLSTSSSSSVVSTYTSNFSSSSSISSTSVSKLSSSSSISSTSTSKPASSSMTSLTSAGSSAPTLSSSIAPVSRSSSSSTTRSTTLTASATSRSSASSSFSASISASSSSRSSPGSATPITSSATIHATSSTVAVTYETSTVYKTITSTISTCASNVVNCPYTTHPVTVTDTVVDYVTTCPVESVQTTAPAVVGSSTIYKTIISTISSCASTVLNCPYRTAPATVTNIVVASVIPATSISMSSAKTTSVVTAKESSSKITSVASANASSSKKTTIATIANTSSLQPSSVIVATTPPSKITSVVVAVEPTSVSASRPASQDAVSTASGSLAASTSRPAVATGAAGRLSISFGHAFGIVILAAFML